MSVDGQTRIKTSPRQGELRHSGLVPHGPVWNRADSFRFVLLLVVYAVSCWIGLEWTRIEGVGPPIWMPAGIAVAGLILGGASLWPALVLGHLAAGLATGSEPWWAELMLALGAGLSSLFGVWPLRRWRIASDLSDLVSLLRFLLTAGVIKALASAAVTTLVAFAATGSVMPGWHRFFGLWFAGEIAGVIVVGPLVLSWARGSSLRHPFYLALIAAATAMVGWLAFMEAQGGFFRIWHVLPILIWSALAFQIRGASLTLLIVTLFATLGTVEGAISFTDGSGGPLANVPYLQQFIAIAGLTVLVIAAIDSERRQKGEDRVRLALDAAGQGSFEIDLRQGFVSGDPVACRLLGLPDAHYVPFERLVAALHAEDRDRVRAAIAESAQVGRDGQFRVEARIATPDDSICWVALHGRTSFDGDDTHRRPVATRGVVRDITTRKTAEQRVVESERFTRSVLDNLFAFVAVLTPDGTLIEANRAPLEIARLDPSEVVGRKFWDCYWWSYSPKVQRRLRQAIRKAMEGELVRYDEQVRVAGGRLIWIDFQLAPLRDHAGTITHLIPSGIDMTARMEAENARQRLVSILEATPDFIGTVDSAGRITYLNPGARRIIGVSPSADVTRFTLAELQTASAHARVLIEGFPEAADREVWEGESEVVASDGRVIPVSQVILPHRDELGRVMQYSTIMRDISEQKRAQRHQAMLLKELSHRVKNTLAVIQSIARQTLRTTPEPEAFAEIFQGRVASLAASHSLLTDTDWQGAEAHRIMERQLDPVLGADRRRYRLSGPRILLPAEPATQLGMVLHELATNAMRHGALASASGLVTVEWEPSIAGLRFRWLESGGKPCAAPEGRHGFGSKLIDMSVRDVVRRYGEEGLAVEFTLELPPSWQAPQKP